MDSTDRTVSTQDGPEPAPAGGPASEPSPGPAPAHEAPGTGSTSAEPTADRAAGAPPDLAAGGGTAPDAADPDPGAVARPDREAPADQDHGAVADPGAAAAQSDSDAAPDPDDPDDADDADDPAASDPDPEAASEQIPEPGADPATGAPETSEPTAEGGAQADGERQSDQGGETGEDGDSTPSDPDRWAAFAPVPPKPPGRLRRAAAAVGRALIHEWTLATLGALALAVLLTWPALRYPQYTLPQDLGDPTLVTWLLAWPGHILLTDPTQLWHGNAFFPERWSYAFTDSLLGYAPAGMIGEGPTDAVLRYNIIYVLAHALAFLGAYLLARQLGADPVGALVMGLAFGYAPWRLAQAGHLHVLSTGGIALALAMLARGHGWSLRYGWHFRKVRPTWIILGWLVAAWQITIGFGIGLPFAYVLAGIAVAVSVAWLFRRILRRERQPVGRIIAANLVGGVIFAAVTVLMALPYLTVVELHPQARRHFDVLYAFSPPPLGFITAPAESWLWGSMHAGAREMLSWPPEMALLPGFGLIGLALAGVFCSVWSLRARLLLVAALAATVVLAMGTEFFDGVVYRPLHEYLPGWDALRTPGRLIIWITLLLGVLAAGALTALRIRARELALHRRGSATPGMWLRIAIVIPLLLVFLESFNHTPHVVVPPQPAPLATVEGPVLVLPSNEATDQLVMLWSTDRFIPLVNGSSGFTPESLTETRRITQTFPDPQSVSYLRSLGVATVIVLPDRVVGTPWEPALRATGDGLGISREEVGGMIVFRLN